jgi:hypothetical protein
VRAIRTAILIKTILTLFITGSVPAVLFWLAWLLFLYSAGGLHHLLADFTGFFSNAVFMVFITLILAVPYSFAHLLLLGVPALVLGWRLRAIHWSSVVVTSFLIGAIPTGLLGVYSALVDQVNLSSVPFGAYAVGFGLVLSVATIMGLFGMTAGVAFWFLWRYWVFSDSPTDRPLSLFEAKKAVSSADARVVP